jgi:hypothetical protein
MKRLNTLFTLMLVFVVLAVPAIARAQEGPAAEAGWTWDERSAPAAATVDGWTWDEM